MPDALYDTIGSGYATRRKPDPRIAAAISAALGDARSVINVGAGAGSYEPSDREVLAIEPSELMIAQRPLRAARCLQGIAEALPAADASFDAAMAILTIHHWSNWRAGLMELRRVARKRVVVLTWDSAAWNFWLTTDYFPEIATYDKTIAPPIDEMVAILGEATVAAVPIPHDCVDGFLGAYWGHPEAYLDPTLRRSISSFARIDATAGLERLAADLQSGRWHERNCALSKIDALDLGYRLVSVDIGNAR